MLARGGFNPYSRGALYLILKEISRCEERLLHESKGASILGQEKPYPYLRRGLFFCQGSPKRDYDQNAAQGQ